MYLPSRSLDRSTGIPPSTTVTFHHGHLPPRSPSTTVTFHHGHLPPRSFHLGHASGPSTMSTVHHGHLPP
ncbi:hypothetical protein N7505_001236 [Penicillium chrysogenum]|uniref:Uncharacterized protein n=1 Tax=Penicillium chrysogenum TaxID=5076 RepID=A0ABQ8WWG6_PENCH|nr:hypothetical protein N7505_001236 [Penicillium chrysogenum]